MKLHTSRYGEKGSPTLLMVHGLFGSGDNLTPIAHLLSSHFDVICPDLRNHGRSPHSQDMSYSAMAADLLELLEDLGSPDACLLGHSLGGKVVMRFALDYPKRATKMVVAEIGPKAYGPLFVELFQILEELDLSRFSSRSEAAAALRASIPDPAVHGLMMKNLKLNEDGKPNWKMNLQALAAARKSLGLKVEAGAAYPGPACFIRGERSNYVLDEDVPEIKKLFPSMTLQTLVGAGHWLHADQPLAFAESVRQFLQDPS